MGHDAAEAAEMVADLVDNQLLSNRAGIEALARLAGLSRLEATLKLALTLHARDWVPLREWERRQGL